MYVSRSSWVSELRIIYNEVMFKCMHRVTQGMRARYGKWFMLVKLKVNLFDAHHVHDKLHHWFHLIRVIGLKRVMEVLCERHMGSIRSDAMRVESFCVFFFFRFFLFFFLDSIQWNDAILRRIATKLYYLSKMLSVEERNVDVCSLRKGV